MALIMGIQIIAILFALFMGYYAFINYKRKQLKTGEFSFWIVVWLCFLLAAIFPTYLERMAKSLSIHRTMDFLTILGFFFVIMLLFYNYVQVRKNSYKLEEIVRKLAYRKVGKKKR
jgi:hypothetical protein